MSPAIKRKKEPSNESFIRSGKTTEIDGPPSKRVRKEAPLVQTHKEDKAPKHVGSVTLQVTKIAGTKREEAAFPRGGASVLTPLEHKQIHIEATRDVLFEQQTASKKREKQDEEPAEPIVLKSTGKKRKSKNRGQEMTKKQHAEDELVKIDSLSYKRLVPGSLVLGQISEINIHDLALALPNNLTGYVPVTSISDRLTRKAEKLASIDIQSDLDGQEEDDDIELKSMFYVGQYLRASVVSTNDEPMKKVNEKGKRRIELSLRPQEANMDITAKELVPYSMVMASILSVEDHGLIMDLGLSDSGVRGFMSSKEIGHSRSTLTVQEGAVFLCMITGLSSNGKIVKLCADTEKIANVKKSNYLAEGPTVDVFLPGTAVELLITDITAKGITGKIMGMIDVTCDLIHSGAIMCGTDLNKK